MKNRTKTRLKNINNEKRQRLIENTLPPVKQHKCIQLFENSKGKITKIKSNSIFSNKDLNRSYDKFKL